jgi:hypothetical protein
MTSINPQKTSTQPQAITSVNSSPSKVQPKSPQSTKRKEALQQGLATARKDIKQSVSLTIVERQANYDKADLYRARKDPKLYEVHSEAVYASAVTFGRDFKINEIGNEESLFRYSDKSIKTTEQLKQRYLQERDNEFTKFTNALTKAPKGGVINLSMGSSPIRTLQFLLKDKISPELIRNEYSTNNPQVNTIVKQDNKDLIGERVDVYKLMKFIQDVDKNTPPSAAEKKFQKVVTDYINAGSVIIKSAGNEKANYLGGNYNGNLNKGEKISFNHGLLGDAQQTAPTNHNAMQEFGIHFQKDWQNDDRLTIVGATEFVTLNGKPQEVRTAYSSLNSKVIEIHADGNNRFGVLGSQGTSFAAPTFAGAVTLYANEKGLSAKAALAAVKKNYVKNGLFQEDVFRADVKANTLK